MSVSVSGTTVTFPDSSTITSGWTGFKNRIINGAMVIDQRNAGASVTPANGAYTLDRWKATEYSTASKFSVQQNAGGVTPPVGFKNYLGVTSLSAYSVGANEIYAISQGIEGYNVADMAWGTANAKSFTLSFWVYSSLTGTFGGVFANNAEDRVYPFTYTISSANTWQQISITVAGDTSGTWLTNNQIGMWVRFGLGGGSTWSGTPNTWGTSGAYTATGATSVVAVNGATWYITGVQLEKGSTASSFEYRAYGQELALCQRYCWVYRQGGSGGLLTFASAYATTAIQGGRPLPVTMRSTPTLSFSGVIQISEGQNVYNSSSSSFTGTDSDTGNLHFWIGGYSGLTQFRGYFGNMQTAGQTLTVSAEL
jgi:hypothetical protein